MVHRHRGGPPFPVYLFSPHLQHMFIYILCSQRGEQLVMFRRCCLYVLYTMFRVEWITSILCVEMC